MAQFVTEIVCYGETLRGTIRQRETASLVYPVIFGFGAPFLIGMGRAPTTTDRYRSFTGGILAGPVLIESDGAAECLQINFTPLGIRRFFGFPAHDLAERVEPLDSLSDPALTELENRLAGTEDWTARLDRAETFVRDRLMRAPPLAAPIAEAYRLIQARRGDVRIGRLAGQLGFSRKHLLARFREEIGASPKSVARIVRFNHAQRLAVAEPRMGWASIAAESGYADQAHLAREFRALAGETPAAWRLRAA